MMNSTKLFRKQIIIKCGFLEFIPKRVRFPIFFFLDYLHEHFMKIKIYNRAFTYHINKVRREVEKHIEKWEYWVLLAFVDIPFPGTGAYTGTLIAWFFEMNRKKSFLTIALGVAIAGLIVTLTTLGIINLF